MKLAIVTCCFLSVFAVSASSAKVSVFERLREVETDFEFTVNDSPLDVSGQGITLRTVIDETNVKRSDGEQRPVPHAYRSYHLEIAYKLDYIDRRDYVAIEFYNGNDLVHRIALKDTSRSLQSSSGKRYDFNYLAINLEGVPLVMLDAIDRVNFRKSK